VFIEACFSSAHEQGRLGFERQPVTDHKIYTVVGTAVSALAVATELRLKNHAVVLSGRPEDRTALMRLSEQPGISVNNEASNWGFGPGEFLVDGIGFEPDLRAAIAKADVIFVMVQPSLQEALLSPCADLLRNDQILLLSPGGLGGALLASRLAAAHSAQNILIGQTPATPHAAQPNVGGGIRVTGKKRSLPVGVFPAVRTKELLDRLADDFPQFTGSVNVIENGFSAAALGLHPVPMIMNATQIEQKGSYVYDGYDITPSIARVIDAVDAERQQILRAIGGNAQSFADVLIKGYGVSGSNFYEVVHSVSSYKQVTSPPDLRYRYLSEDVPTQAVPAALLARALGIPTPTIDAMVAFANAMHGVDYWKSGWNFERLGLSGLEPNAILEFLRTGRRPGSAVA
jgi:opine dehydrogenase